MAKLQTETNTASMERRILRAFKVWLGNQAEGYDPVADFEHGQWWITDKVSGAQWSVVDAQGGRAVDGFDFENVTEGEE